jgi:hypothetical protein
MRSKLLSNISANIKISFRRSSFSENNNSNLRRLLLSESIAKS